MNNGGTSLFHCFMKNFLIFITVFSVMFISQPYISYAETTDEVVPDFDYYYNPNVPDDYEYRYYVHAHTDIETTVYNPYYTDYYCTYVCASELVAFHCSGTDRVYLCCSSGGLAYYSELRDSYYPDLGRYYHEINNRLLTVRYYTISDMDLSHNFIDNKNINFIETNIKIFSDEQSARAYLSDGSLDGLISDGVRPFEYNEEIGFDDFRVEIHASNHIKKYFVRFYYTPTEFMREHNGVCDVDFDYNLEYSTDILGIDVGSDSCAGSFSLDLSVDYFDFYPYDNFDDADCRKLFSGKEAMGFADLDDVGLGDLNFGNIWSVSLSNCCFEFIPSVSGVYGNKFNALIDFLNNSSECYWSAPVYDEESETYISNYEPVPESYTTTKDYYYTEVSQDNYGNNTYNYYYINNYGISTPIDDTGVQLPSDSSSVMYLNGGIKHEVSGVVQHVFSSDLNININSSSDDSGGSASAPGIVIEDDDYSGTSFTDNLTNLYGLKDDLDTAAEDDGALSFLKDFFGVLPGEIPNTVGYGIGTVVFVAIFRSLLRR